MSIDHPAFPPEPTRTALSNSRAIDVPVVGIVAEVRVGGVSAEFTLIAIKNGFASTSAHINTNRHVMIIFFILLTPLCQSSLISERHPMVCCVSLQTHVIPGHSGKRETHSGRLYRSVPNNHICSVWIDCSEVGSGHIDTQVHACHGSR